jgi:hypothetical protein
VEAAALIAHNDPRIGLQVVGLLEGLYKLVSGGRSNRIGLGLER